MSAVTHQHPTTRTGRDWSPTLALALVVSLVAALVAIVLRAATDVSDTTIVVAVIVVAFTVSWIDSGRRRGTA
ncbi:MAG: hypothetical protein MUE78_02180 [Ilumatobacteraceae bacterium]|nr:hypothetical protein [Ilumatobacteraceae bacterium]